MAVEKTKKLDGEVAKHLATLALARSIVEGDVAAARAALKAGADPEAYWIDGHRRLRELIKPHGPVRVSAGITKLLTPQAIKKLPSMKEDEALWSKTFVDFVAKRGYDFKGKTMPLAGGGTDIQLDTAKDGVNLIAKKSRLLVDATCADGVEGVQGIEKSRGSRWRLEFRADWDKRDRRIVGFWVSFNIDASGWEVLERYKQARSEGKECHWPDPSDPLSAGQKNWEGEHFAERLSEWGYPVTMERTVKYLSLGANPFVKFGGKFVGEDAADPEASAFLSALREAIGPAQGWHARIAPHLTEAGIARLREKAALQLSTPKAAPKKKSMKTRADVI